MHPTAYLEPVRAERSDDTISTSGSHDITNSRPLSARERPGSAKGNLTSSGRSARKRARPDLVARSIHGPPLIQYGQQLFLSTLIKNVGRGKAKKSTVVFWLSTDKRSTPATDLALGVKRVKPLRRNKLTSARLVVKVENFWTDGAYWIIACADGNSRLKEKSERNNCTVSSKQVSLSEHLHPPPQIRSRLSLRRRHPHRARHRHRQ